MIDTQVWLAIIGLAGMVIQGITAYFLKTLNTKQDEAAAKTDATAAKTDEVAHKADNAAVKVEEVKTKLEQTTAHTDAKLDEIQNSANAIHTLVNSNMSVQLKISMLALKRVAELDPSAANKAAAEAAENAFHEHESKQRVVDNTAAAAAAAAAAAKPVPVPSKRDHRGHKKEA